MIYWGRRKTDHWVEPTDCNKFVVWDALWPSPAPAIDTTSQLRHRCSGFVWARHALIEPSVEGHKAVERKRLPPFPVRSRIMSPFFRGNPGSCEELPGFLSCIRPSRRTAIETLGRRPTVRNAQRRQLREPRKRLPYRAPRYTRPHGYQNTQHTNARRGCANDAARLRSRARRGALCPVAIGPHAPGQRVQLPLARGFRPAAKAAASCCASRTWTIAVSARNLPLN